MFVKKLTHLFLTTDTNMEFPDDVLQLIREYTKPSEPYKMYTRVLKVLVNRLPPISKLKRAVRFHYERFLPLFLELEKTYRTRGFCKGPLR
jgi:hypothetical protein